MRGQLVLLHSQVATANDVAAADGRLELRDHLRPRLAGGGRLGIAIRGHLVELQPGIAGRQDVAGADRVLVFRPDLFAGQWRLAVRGADGERGGENESE